MISLAESKLTPEQIKSAHDRLSALNVIQGRLEKQEAEMKAAGDLHMAALKRGDSEMEARVRKRMHEIFDEQLDCRMDIAALVK